LLLLEEGREALEELVVIMGAVAVLEVIVHLMEQAAVGHRQRQNLG
jgi:hypothetical protein